ncbi:GntR family transcriptional regulator [Novipirellula caenicola]|uniref:HTH-type transcriptional repressor GlaR n=1 Tax=Novipirellula caenicola TaxID=1536901 RepID=A0ABP9VWK0_9BACT
MSTETNASRAYQHLRNKLISGEFEPGARLLYGPIGKEIGVSATPVREAAGQLANEGLVDLVPNMGAIVRSLDRSALIDIYEVREVIEPYTAARAAERATPEQIAKIQAELKRMEELTAKQEKSSAQYAGKRIKGQFDKADYQFHMLIIEATGNQALVHTASQSQVLTRVFAIRRHRHDVVAMKRTCKDHQKIFRAIKKHDAEAAREAAAAHIRNGLKVSLIEIDENENGEA